MAVNTQGIRVAKANVRISDLNFREDQSHKLKQMIARADHIIVPATFTKVQLVTRIGVEENKISVVAEGVRDVFLRNTKKAESTQLVREHFKIRNPFLLFVGTLEKRKNVIGVIRTFTELNRNVETKLDLVLVGSPGYQYEDIEAEVKKSGLENQIKILGFVGETSLAELYQACEAFIFLSFEEGFGIPVIEAMSCGAPVLSSNTTSLPEVGQGHTWLVDPHDPVQAAKTLATILSKTPEVLKKIEEGKKYARTQTWMKVAEETRKVYEKVLRI